MVFPFDEIGNLLSSSRMSIDDKRLPALDGLRGIAALFVVLSHYLIDTGWAKEIGRHIGSVGVMLFFCLSGFLMMHVTKDESPTGKNALMFYVRRLARVGPLFVFALVFVLAYQMTAKSMGIPARYLAFNPIHNVTNMLLNLISVRGDGVFWTIGPEILFYFLFPVLWLARSRSVATVMLIIVIIYGFQRSTGFWVSADYNFTRLNLVIHFFMFGSLAYLAYASPIWQSTSDKLKDAIFLIVAFISVSILPGIDKIAYGITLMPHDFYQIYDGQPLLWMVFPTLILAAVSAPLAKIIFSPKIFSVLGLISYSIYIWHTPVVRASMYFRQTSTVGLILMLALVVAVVLVISYISYKFIEKPARVSINGWVDQRRQVARANDPSPQSTASPVSR